ncbi:MAG: hypothetical protein AAF630_12510 [Cyanobacteria bacterium P01_C01_bin.38]
MKPYFWLHIKSGICFNYFAAAFETQILHQCQKPGFFSISERDIHTFTTRNRVSLSQLQMVQDIRR